MSSAHARMQNPLRILRVEDDPADAELIRETLEAAGLACAMARRVESRDEFVRALAAEPFDLILADYRLPAFDGLSALAIARGQKPDVPFILVSGTMGEDAAVDSLKAGATDYVLKDRLGRLAPAVTRACQEAEERVKRRRAEEALRESESRFRRLADCGIIGIIIADVHGRITQANDTFLAMTGYGRGDLPLRWDAMTPPEYRPQDERVINRLLKTGTGPPVEKEFLRKHGRRVSILIGSALLSEETGDCMCFVLDISERKQAERCLQAALREKEALLKEIHHRVKNNLQLISSLLSLQAGGIKDQAALELIADSRSRVRSIALVHENLYRAGSVTGLPLAAHVQVLFRSYNLGGHRIRLETHLADVPLDLDQAVPCVLIVNELVSNALKHAFPDGRAGRVLVEFRSLDGQQYTLSVADDGVGLPADFEVSRPDSLGLQLVGDLAQQLRGTIAVNREGGTAFTITFEANRTEPVRLAVAQAGA
jgi:PAS domain S-box-containing protein